MKIVTLTRFKGIDRWTNDVCTERTGGALTVMGSEVIDRTTNKTTTESPPKMLFIIIYSPNL